MVFENDERNGFEKLVDFLNTKKDIQVDTVIEILDTAFKKMDYENETKKRYFEQEFGGVDDEGIFYYLGQPVCFCSINIRDSYSHDKRKLIDVIAKVICHPNEFISISRDNITPLED